MGNQLSNQDYYYNPLTGTYEYLSEYERYRRMMYSQYYPTTTSAGYNLPTSYYNTYAQQYYQPSMYQSYYNNTLGYGYGASPYQQQSLYNAYGSPMYGYTNNSYYPNYLQRTYM